MIPVEPWPGLTVCGVAGEGARSDVWRGELGGLPVAIRKSRRTISSLEWELDLLNSLHAKGFTIPTTAPTLGGELHWRGWSVHTWIDGRTPATPDDWRLVALELQRLHRLFPNHPQRPGACTVTELADIRSSIDADLNAIPPEVVARCLRHFDPYVESQTSIIHGDPGPSNIRITPTGRVGLLDWDEARRDIADLDLANLDIAILDGHRRTAAEAAAHAWETLNGWTAEPAYARSRFEQLN